MKRYEYKYHILTGIPKKLEPRCRAIIDEEAKKGWRLVQIFVPLSTGLVVVRPRRYEIIFEREVESPRS